MRTKPSAKLTDSTNPASEETYQALVQSATEAVIMRQKDILLKFPYFVKLCKGFPRGVKEKHDDLYDVYRVKVQKLINWLYEQGHSPHNYTDIMKATRELAYLEGSIDKMLNGSGEDSATNNEEENDNQTSK